MGINNIELLFQPETLDENLEIFKNLSIEEIDSLLLSFQTYQKKIPSITVNINFHRKVVRILFVHPRVLGEVEKYVKVDQMKKQQKVLHC